MIIEKYDGGPERVVLIGMITSTAVVSRISARWKKEGLFASRWTNLIGGWCVKNYRDHGQAIGQAILPVFHRWQRKQRDEATVKLVDQFLASLSDEFEQGQGIAVANMLETANWLFEKVSLEKTREDLHAYLQAGDVERARQTVKEAQQAAVTYEELTDFGNDETAVDEVFAEDERRSLVPYDGGLAKFYGRQMCRDGFIAFCGPRKRGKTWFLLDTAYRALEDRRRVLFLQIGDLTRPQMMERFLIRTARHPIDPGDGDWPLKVPYPVSVKPAVGKEDAKVTYREDDLVFDGPLNRHLAGLALDNLRSTVRSNRTFLKIKCVPAGTMTVQRIGEIAEDLIGSGWQPDLIVLDYADLLSMPGRMQDRRGHIGEAWQQLRALSQRLSCLVVTATQANRAAESAKLVLPEHLSEDISKGAHVTGMVGINQTAGEKDINVYRLNWVFRRDGRFNPYACCTVASCLTTGEPTVCSAF